MRQSTTIRFPSDRTTLEGYLARPEGPGRFPGVVVLHEVFGVNHNIRGIADRLAMEGYVALAPDLYSRPGGFARFCATQMVKAFMNNSVDQQAVRDLKSAVAYLQGLESVQADRIGVVGFCLGGGYSLLLACASDQVKASVVFYGRNPAPIEAVASIQCPLLFFYGEEDRFIRDGVPKLQEAMRRHGKQMEVHAYPNASHSFMNDRRRSYRPEAASDAWRHTLEFFRRHLKSPVP
jgi:carboxymethylenebutenolidase